MIADLIFVNREGFDSKFIKYNKQNELKLKEIHFCETFKKYQRSTIWQPYTSEFHRVLHRSLSSRKFFMENYTLFRKKKMI